jgi:hypothetical protein
MSLEQALTLKRKNRIEVTDHLGNKFRSIAAMVKYHGVSKSAYESRIKAGMSIEEALTTPANYTFKAVTDHLGNTFESMSHLAKYWNIDYSKLISRLKNGMSMQDAITKPTGWRGDYVDHLGNTFKSVNEMCEKYGINATTYAYRIQNNWPIKAILLIKGAVRLHVGFTVRPGYTIVTVLDDAFFECDIDGERIVCSKTKILSDMADAIEERT